MDTQQEFAALQALHPAAALHSEGDKPVVFLPGVKFRSAGNHLQMDLLLHPSAHSGYVTRLFFESRIDGVAQNWTEHTVLGRKWWAPSWKDVVPEQPWTSMLMAHLRAVT